MLQWEFNQRIGEESSYDEYVLANAVYMECSLDKDSFCKCWLALRDNDLFFDIFNRYEDMKKTNKTLEEYYGY